LSLKASPVAALELIELPTYSFTINDPVYCCDDSFEAQGMGFFHKFVVEIILIFLPECIEISPDKSFDLLKLVTSNDILAL
jgi:hypothetical protein